MNLDDDSYFEQDYLKQQVIKGCFEGFKDLITETNGHIKPMVTYVYRDNKGMHLGLESLFYGAIRFYAEIPAKHPIMPPFIEKPIIADRVIFYYSLS